MTLADLITDVVKSGVDLRKPARIYLGGGQHIDVLTFDGPISSIVPVASLYTQADLDAAKDEAYRQGVADAEAGEVCLEPVGAEGGAR